ncbi:MAG: hypothetical protein DCC68_24255, partial [Planctomycetota bacterium]
MLAAASCAGTASAQLRFVHHFGDRDLGGRNLGQTDLADLDRDGDLDFITGEQRGRIFWFELQIMKNFVTGRLLWMDTHQPLSNTETLPRPPAFGVPGGLVPSETAISLATADAGVIYYSTDGSDPRLPGGAINPTAQVYDAPISIESNTRVVARVLRDGVWSGRNEALYVTEPISLVVTEINYNPANPTPAEIAAGFADNDDFEFLEFRNVGTEPLDLGGVSVTDGIAFTFSSSILPAGERMLVVKNPEAFALRYGLGHNVAGTYDGNLANDGEPITVHGPLGEVILDFVYDDAWYALADGEGFTLSIIDGTAAPTTWNLAESWRPSDYSGGSPSSSDAGIAPPADSLRINEILLDTSHAAGQRIELYNASTAPIDVSGFYLSDDPADPTKYRLPLGLSPILPDDFLVLDAATTFGAALPPSLGGGELFLRSADASGAITGFRTSEEFTAAETEVAQGWYVKSTGGHDFTPLELATLGSANSAPRFGPVVINELMYHPLAAGDEFIELHNIGRAPVSLENWSFASGVDFTFGATTLGGGQYLLVVGIDPETFRAKYSLPAGVQIVGPFTGKLENEGENVELSRPNAVSGAVRVDRVNYNTSDLWPIRPKGIGASLSRIDSSAYGNDVANWAAGIAAGSPGWGNSVFDDTPPSVPTNVIATVQPGNRIVLTWSPSIDLQSATDHYTVYPNGGLYATVSSPTFADTIVDTNRTYAYEIAAVNTALEESSRSESISARVLTLISILPLSATALWLRFNSPVDAASTQNISNYVVPGLDILDATIDVMGDAVVLTTPPQATGQVYRVVVNGVTSDNGAMIQPDSQSKFTAGVTPGLRGEYFNDPVTSAQPNTDSLLPGNLVLTRVDPLIDTGPTGLAWPATGSPAPGVNADYFSVRWTGKVRTLAAGDYKFSVQASDGMRVWLWPEGQAQPATPTIDRWINSSFNTFTSPFIALSGDTLYNFVTEYYETTGSASAFVRWILPGQAASAVIPASQYSLATALETTPPQVSSILVSS